MYIEIYLTHWYGFICECVRKKLSVPDTCFHVKPAYVCIKTNSCSMYLFLYIYMLYSLVQSTYMSSCLLDSGHNIGPKAFTLETFMFTVLTRNIRRHAPTSLSTEILSTNVKKEEFFMYVLHKNQNFLADQKVIVNVYVCICILIMWLFSKKLLYLQKVLIKYLISTCRLQFLLHFVNNKERNRAWF